MFFIRRDRNQSGFTLIEVLAALSVFAVMTVGITPLLISSMRGSALAKSQTVAKNIVSEAMERARGLPFFDVAVNRDFLDMYFPNMGTGYSSGTGIFTTVCTPTGAVPSASGARACPARHSDGTSRLPADYELTFTARFVKPSGLTPETFTTVIPVNYDSATEATALPPTQLVEMTVTARWTEMGKPREFGLVTLVGDRRLSIDKANAIAAVDHVFSVTTAYKDGTGRVSGMTGTGGSVTSYVEIKAVASAASDATASEFLLSNQQTDIDPGGQLASILGAQARLRAPLNVSPAPIVSALEASITHPSIPFSGPIGFMGPTAANESVPTPGVQVVSGYPRSTANVASTGGVGTHFYATNQADLTGEGSVKKFDPFKQMFSVQRPSGSERMLADSYAEATPAVPVSGRKVEARATGKAPRFAFLPVSFITTGSTGAVVVIDSFTATVNCKATGNASAALATGSWSASLRYWKDASNNSLPVGSYETLSLKGNVDGSVTSDQLAGVRTENPLVYDSAVDANDVYLFTDSAAGKNGYLDSWSSTFQMDGQASAKESSVSMPYAINIVTSRTNSTNEESKFTVSIGKLSCRAVDNRG